MFSYLFGWDFKTNMSKPEGGILGHPAAWYGLQELTERGGIHGHYLIWCLGSINPTELHRRMESDTAFEMKVCSYFDDIIWHHLPNITLPKEHSADRETRSERPVPPPAWRDNGQLDVPLSLAACIDDPTRFSAALDAAGSPELSEWWLDFVEDVKVIGEALQRHRCRKVCHKYDHTECRFLFPHEIVEKTHFDTATRSLRIRVLDATINYLNFVVSYCARHNIDIKPLPSGRSFKAAMFYVTDYITKLDEKTYHTLSLLSRAIVANKQYGDPTESPEAAAKHLLHRCLSQLTRRQQIHAQQAAWYIRGYTDSWSSHTTVNMSSGALMGYIFSTYSDPEAPSSTGETPAAEAEELDEEEEERRRQEFDEPTEMEELSSNVRLVIDPKKQQLASVSQLDSYLYRDRQLDHICFFEFVHRFRVQRKVEVKGTRSAFPRYELLHADFRDTHEIVEHTNYDSNPLAIPKVPVVMGCGIPRSRSRGFAPFVLAHFKPFSASIPLKQPNESFNETLEGFTLSDLGKRITTNWEAIHECEDERDAERLKKSSSRMKTQLALKKTMRDAVEGEVDLLTVNEMPASYAEGHIFKDFLDTDLGKRLMVGRWIKSSLVGQRVPICTSGSLHQSVGNFVNLRIRTAAPADHSLGGLEVTAQRVNEWMVEMKDQEEVAKTRHVRDSLPEVHAPDGASAALVNIEQQISTEQAMEVDNPRCVEPSVQQRQGDETAASVDAIVREVAEKWSLNDEQKVVYHIVCRAFLARKNKASVEPLRMFINGPGGTGKTYTLRAVQDLMKVFQCEHRIRFMAPSGAAASLIGGVTIHSGLKLRVKRRQDSAKAERGAYDIPLSIQQKLDLQQSWEDIDILVVDEVSMVSCELLAEVDATARIAKCGDKLFGGLIVIFAGDFYQYAPVMATSLYETIETIEKKLSSNRLLLAKLGRLAWKYVNTVVDLHRQERMKDDPAFAGAVLRLRTGSCTAADVALFNSRVIKSALHPRGIDMGPGTPLHEATVIVRGNRDRIQLNACKAYDLSDEVIWCAAQDYIDGKPVTNYLTRNFLLNLDQSAFTNRGSIPGYVALFPNMPVIMRRHNPAPILGVANGSQGVLRRFDIEEDSFGLPTLKSSIIEFESSTVKLKGLPKGHVPFLPYKYAFRVILPSYVTASGREERVLVHRTGPDYDPAFAITGHCAQGKTLEAVATTVGAGGPSAYVPVSRARRTKDLVLLKHVSRRLLNRDRNENLVLEMNRLAALRHNTLIRFSRETRLIPEPEGGLIEVPDPDGFTPLPALQFIDDKGKRKADSTEGDDVVDLDEDIPDDEGDVESERPKKRRKACKR